MELSELFREYGPALKKKYQGKLLPSHLHAIDAILACRTPDAGEMVVQCPHCAKIEYMAHSCGHRSCPKCQNHETGEWLNKQIEKLLPVPYFLVTFTVPAELRSIAWSNQRLFFGKLFEASVLSLRNLACDERFLGGNIGMTGVLHTNSRRLDFHPHVHFIIPAGAIDVKNRFWKRKDWHFLFPEPKLASIFRKLLLKALEEEGLFFPDIVREVKWVVKCQEVGSGEPALKYLSRYLYRGVISEKRIIENQNGMVGFLYRESKTGKLRKRTLPGEDFLWLVLRHVLPRGFRRTRDFGFLHGNAVKTLRLIQLLLYAKVPVRIPEPRPVFQCSDCGSSMKIIAWRIKRGKVTSRSPP